MADKKGLVKQIYVYDDGSETVVNFNPITEQPIPDEVVKDAPEEEVTPVVEEEVAAEDVEEEVPAASEEL